MDQEMVAKKSPKLLWVVIGVVVIAVGVGVWFFTREEKSESTTTTTTSTAPKNADWLSFAASKYGLKFYYPSTYTVVEGTSGSITISKGTAVMIDIYSSDTAGDDTGSVRAQTALFTDATKSYMTGGVETTTIAGGVSAKMVTGTFGKYAGARQNHEGVAGSAVVFAKNSRLWVVDSFDAGDATAKTVFADFIADIHFN